MAYVPQNPWCQNMTLRESILFGAEMDEDYYDEVIEACALTLDLQVCVRSSAQQPLPGSPLDHPL